MQCILGGTHLGTRQAKTAQRHSPTGPPSQFSLIHDDHDDDHDVDDDKDGDVKEGTGGEPGADHSVGDSVNIRQHKTNLQPCIDDHDK